MRRLIIFFATACVMSVISLADKPSLSSKTPQDQDATEQAARMRTLRDALAHPFDDLTGKPAENFSVTTLDEKSLQLGDLKGRPIILSFLRVKECLPCIRQLDVLSKISTKYRKSTLAIVALFQARAGLESSREEIQRVVKPLPGRLWIAYATEKMASAYGNNKLVPYNVYVNSAGKIAQQSAGQSLELMDRDVHRLFAGK